MLFSKKVKNKGYSGFRKGFSVLEILLVTALFAIFSTGIFILSLDSLQRTATVELDTAASFYAQEGIEAVRNIRDREFLELINGDHGLNFSGGQWSFIVAPETIDSTYERVITIEDVYRNDVGDIDDEGTTLDPDIKRVTSEVSWLSKGILPQSVKYEALFTNWRGDDWITTTCTEFDLGEYDQTQTEDSVGPPVDNCGVILVEVVSEGVVFSSANLGKHGTDVTVEGNYAYMSVNDTNNGFAVINVTDPSTPTVADQVDIGHKGRYVHKSGATVYVGVEKADEGLAVINVNTPSSALLLDSIDVGDYGNEPETQGEVLYMASGDVLKVIDVTSPGSAVDISEYDFNDDVNVSESSGSYLYVGLADDDSGFRIMSISDPSNVQQVASLDVDDDVNALALALPYVYLGTEDGDNSLKVVDVSDPMNPSMVGSLDVGGEIQDVAISGNKLYAAIDDQNAGFAEVDISSPSSPSLDYNLDIDGKGTGIDVSGDYIYITSDTANKGLIIIQKGSSTLTFSGEYVSDVLDTGSSTTAYQFIEWDHLEVPGGDVKLQIRTASSEAGLTSATWVGPDGLWGSYYTNSRTPIVLHAGSTGPRYFQYRIVMASDGVSSPKVENVRVNYIP